MDSAGTEAVEQVVGHAAVAGATALALSNGFRCMYPVLHRSSDLHTTGPEQWDREELCIGSVSIGGLLAGVSGDVAHQILDCLATVSARNDGVQVAHTVDAIVVRAVGREEVEYHSAVELVEEVPSLLARVDDLIVDDEMDALRVAIFCDELPDQLAKEAACLGSSVHPGEPPGLEI